MIDKEKALAAFRAAVAAQLAAWDAASELADILKPEGIEIADLTALHDDIGTFASGSERGEDIGVESLDMLMEGMRLNQGEVRHA